MDFEIMLKNILGEEEVIEKDMARAMHRVNAKNYRRKNDRMVDAGILIKKGHVYKSVKMDNRKPKCLDNSVVDDILASLQQDQEGRRKKIINRKVMQKMIKLLDRPSDDSDYLYQLYSLACQVTGSCDLCSRGKRALENILANKQYLSEGCILEYLESLQTNLVIFTMQG